MRWKCVWPLLLLAGCDQGEPPFDQLPLRDALRADPAVLAGLSDATRARLASRFEAARTGDTTVDHFSEDPSPTPGSAVAKMDQARQARKAEPLLLGLLRDGAAWPIDGDHPSPAPLPPLGGVPATSSADVEARALDGRAGAELRILMAASGAQHLERVVGWPSGAVAIDDTLYVNAGWLVVLARADAEGLDGGLPDGAAFDGGLPTQAQGAGSPGVSPTAAVPFPTGAPPSSIEEVTGAVADTTGPGGRADAGAPAPTQTAPPSSTSEPTALDDGCATCADAFASSDGESCESGSPGDGSDEGEYASDDGGESTPEDTASEGSDACASSDQSSGDSCTSESGEVDASGMDSSGCQIAPRAKAPKKKGSHLSAWLLAPVGYLFYRRRP